MTSQRLSAQIFDTDEAVFATAARLPQLEYLVRQQSITPTRPAPRRGMSRGFSLLNLIEIAVGVELMKSVPSPIVAKAITMVRERWDDLSDAELLIQSDYVLVIHRLPLSARIASSSREPTIVIIPSESVSAVHEQVVFLRSLPLLAIMTNVEQRAMALETWNASRPNRERRQCEPGAA